MRNTQSIKKAILAGRIIRGMNFYQKVWALTVQVPPGRVTTYGAIARALGCKAYRAVGMAMNCNPYAPKVPCHRVVGSTGALTGYAGGLNKKRQLLQSEGIEVRNNRVPLGKAFKFRV